MEKLTKSVTIAAPPEKVYAYLADPTTMLQFWPSMVDVRDVHAGEDGRKKYSWTYKMGGMKFDGASEQVELIPGERIVAVSKHGIENRFDWTFEPAAGGTRLTVQAEYSVPVPLLGRLAEAILVKQNEREADVMLANLKMLIEESQPVKTD
jgi:uncharacterized protein YndB with AHSA1/START domain